MLNIESRSSAVAILAIVVQLFVALYFLTIPVSSTVLRHQLGVLAFSMIAIGLLWLFAKANESAPAARAYRPRY